MDSGRQSSHVQLKITYIQNDVRVTAVELAVRLSIVRDGSKILQYKTHGNIRIIYGIMGIFLKFFNCFWI